MNVQNKRLIGILIAVVVLLLVPFVAMQFTDEVNWDETDFIVMGFLLLSIGLLCELALRMFRTTRHRVIVCGVILLAFFLIWAELAVGVFGTPFAGS